MAENKRSDIEVEFPGVYSGVYPISGKYSSVNEDLEVIYYCFSCGVEIGYYSRQCPICERVFEWGRSDQDQG